MQDHIYQSCFHMCFWNLNYVRASSNPKKILWNNVRFDRKQNKSAQILTAKTYWKLFPWNRCMASSKILTNYTAKSNCTKSKHQINPNPNPGPKQRDSRCIHASWLPPSAFFTPMHLHFLACWRTLYLRSEVVFVVFSKRFCSDKRSGIPWAK
jgi:hypothetical protein